MSGHIAQAERLESAGGDKKIVRHQNGIECLIRYLAIDERLRQKPFPSLLDLLKAVEKRLGRESAVRTIQLDIQHMRFDSGLKAYAPIEILKTGIPGFHYHYSNPDYSFIKQISKP